MKAIYFFLFLSVNLLAKNTEKEVVALKLSNPKNNLENPLTEPEKNNIAGLKILNYDSKKLGKHIYVVSEFYAEKKVDIFNAYGKLVSSYKTTGSPIYLSKFEKGIYYLKITENNKTETKDLVIN